MDGESDVRGEDEGSEGAGGEEVVEGELGGGEEAEAFCEVEVVCGGGVSWFRVCGVLGR